MQINIVVSQNNGPRAVNNNITSQLRTKTGKNTTAGSVFGAPCKVTISREGRRLSEQSKRAEPQSADASMARLMLRQQEQAEQFKKDYSDTLDAISNLMGSIQNSYDAGEDKETIAKKQQALQRLLDLKARQEEENEQRVRDAAGSAAASSKEQEEIDRKNADLYMMLKSFEEKEKKEEEATKGASRENNTEASEDGQGSIGDQFQQSALMLGVSAAKRELEAKDVIDGLSDDGYGRLARANSMMKEIQEELNTALESAGREGLSEEERNQLMSEQTGRAANMMMANYEEITHLRRSGFQEIRDARELALKHIAINPLDGVDRAKQAIMDAGVTAAFSEVSKKKLDQVSQELADRVQEEIDKRNDIVSGAEEETVEEEKTEEDKTKEKNEETEEREKFQEELTKQ